MIRSRMPDHGTVIAYLALFVALGGSAWALAANSVGTQQLKNNAVSAKKVKKGAIASRHVKKNAIGTRQVKKAAIRSRQLAADAVTGAKVRDGSLSASDLDPASSFPPTGSAGGDLGGKYPNPTISGLGPGSFDALPHALVRANSAQVFSNSAVTKVAFELTLATAPGVAFNDGADSLEVSQPGIYLVSASIQWAVHAASSRSIQVRINNGIVTSDRRLAPSGLANQAVTVPLRLEAGDSITSFAAQGSGGDLPTAGSDLAYAKLSAVWMSPLGS